jgi:hypothetical protein
MLRTAARLIRALIVILTAGYWTFLTISMPSKGADSEKAPQVSIVRFPVAEAIGGRDLLLPLVRTRTTKSLSLEFSISGNPAARQSAIRVYLGSGTEDQNTGLDVPGFVGSFGFSPSGSKAPCETERFLLNLSDTLKQLAEAPRPLSGEIFFTFVAVTFDLSLGPPKIHVLNVVVQTTDS